MSFCKMKSIFSVAVVFSLFLIGSIADEAIRNSLITEAHQCCISSCSSERLTSLREQLELYVSAHGEEAYTTKELIEQSLSGAACSTKHAKKANYATLALPPTSNYDVSQSTVSFDVQFTLNIDTGVFYSYIYAYIYFNNTISKTIYPANYYYYDTYANQTKTLTKTVTFTIPRYAPYGIWTITGYGYGLGYTAYTEVVKTFTVAKTVNDVQLPKFVSISAPVFNINDNDLSIPFKATDDVSGVKSTSFYIQNSTQTVGYGSWYAPYVNGAYLTSLLVEDAAAIYLYANTAPGTYAISAYVYDGVDSYIYYSSAQLAAAGLQANVTFAVGNCRAGRFRPYESTSTKCDLCPKGTFSTYGSFKCKACKPGTSSNAAGAYQCVDCPPGTTSTGGAEGCDPCPAGTYTWSNKSESCQPCSPGYTSTEGSESCTGCPSGTYSSGYASTCTPCPVGTFSYGYAFACTPCTPGTYSNTVGSQSCAVCPGGTFSWQGASSCQVCPTPTVNGPPNSNSRLNCY